ncbi:O-antigen ligase family protein [Echinicola pacifica]|nr:O-antigen ligase family protein [Echinicola pacifica]
MAGISNLRNFKTCGYYKLFVVFWVIYFFRLFHDLLYENISVGPFGSFHIFGYAIGNCLIPFLLIANNGWKLNIELFKKLFFFTLLFSNVLIIIGIYIQFGGLSLSMLSDRVSITEGDGSSELVLNTILISFYGAILLLISLNEFLKRKDYVRYTIPFLLGASNLLIGAARGPLLGALLIVFFLIINNIRILNKKAIFLSYGAAFIFIGFIFSSYSYDLNIESIDRISTLFDSDQSGNNFKNEARPHEWNSSWEQFLNNPFIGDKILNDYDNYYPHNIYLEVLLSTGVLGGFFFFIPFLKSLIFNFRLQDDFLKIVFLVNVIFGITTGSLYLNVGFWVSLALIIHLFDGKNESLSSI